MIVKYNEERERNHRRNMQIKSLKALIVNLNKEVSYLKTENYKMSRKIDFVENDLT